MQEGDSTSSTTSFWRFWPVWPVDIVGGDFLLERCVVQVEPEVFRVEILRDEWCLDIVGTKYPVGYPVG